MKKVLAISSTEEWVNSLREDLKEIEVSVNLCQTLSIQKSLDSFQPDVIVLDLCISLEKNTSCLREIQAYSAEKNIPLFCLSEATSKETINQTQKELSEIYPIKQILCKPLKGRKLAQAINQTIYPGTKSLKMILVIDDSPTQLAVTIKQLSSHYRVITASTGREGLRVAMLENPDLILLDLNMPDMNGLKVCADLKSFHPTDQTPIVVYTSSGDSHLINHAFLVGARDCIKKEFYAEEIIKKIDILLESD
ncbi:MAG: response regulator [Candidatus Aureabacteria bacterium]|nr:response regulator [Candidatus Auribacterota bacterium]